MDVNELDLINISGEDDLDYVTVHNCTPDALTQFPTGLFSKEDRQKGCIVLHFIISVYMFASLSVISHHYYVPAIEKLTQSKSIHR
mgnify:CR=1 FL=1